MKRTSILLALSLAFAFSASATILRVNNTPGSDAPYDNFTTAHASAVPGDTIQIEGSNTPYGELTITKRLVVIGPGYFLNENPNTPVSLPATTANINLDRTNANDPFSGASGTEIMGLRVRQTSASRVNVRVSNVSISKCEIDDYVYIQDLDGIVSGVQVFQNFFYGTGLNWVPASDGLTNFNFSNNIVLGPFSVPDNSTGGIYHNVFLGNGFNAELFAGEIRSNIATTTNTNNFNVSTSGNGQVSHNTAANGQFGASNGNNVASPDDIFAGPNGNSTDGQYQLLPGATAVRNNAHDGTDRGAFGGSRPYSLSGLGNIPAIVYLEVPASGTASQPFTVTIRAVSGN
ncbi:MAG: hypothetical protein KDD10_19260 [Phaeodactylibacter sp.]|nr:hypothetical protein [Phaeodactylibacter sp.]MCB9293417.1 hypothetical protein [Lewinellaceae bacterium]